MNATCVPSPLITGHCELAAPPATVWVTFVERLRRNDWMATTRGWRSRGSSPASGRRPWCRRRRSRGRADRRSWRCRARRPPVRAAGQHRGAGGHVADVDVEAMQGRLGSGAVIEPRLSACVTNATFEPSAESCGQRGVVVARRAAGAGRPADERRRARDAVAHDHVAHGVRVLGGDVLRLGVERDVAPVGGDRRVEAGALRAVADAGARGRAGHELGVVRAHDADEHVGVDRCRRCPRSRGSWRGWRTRRRSVGGHPRCERAPSSPGSRRPRRPPRLISTFVPVFRSRR